MKNTKRFGLLLMAIGLLVAGSGYAQAPEAPKGCACGCGGGKHK